MAHELTFTNGAAEMAYVGKKPWHGLGQSLAAGASIEEWKAAAGMAWNIESSPVMFNGLNGVQQSTDKVVLYRGDSSAELGVVGDTYKVVQPTEVLEFFRDLTDAAGFTLDTAGTLFGGKRFWALASIGACAKIADENDRMRRYMLLASSADGSLATTGKYLDIRAVCNNTLSVGLHSDKKGTAIKITHRSVFDEKSVKRALGLETAMSDFEVTMAEFRRMAETPAAPVQTLLRTAELFTPGFKDLDKAEQIKLIEKPSSPTKRVGELWLNRQAQGANLSGAGHSTWGWLNAVTEYIDHESRSRTADRRLESAWYGPGEKIKEAARQVAVEMVQADGSVRTVHQVVTAAVPSGPVTSGADDFAALLARPLAIA